MTFFSEEFLHQCTGGVKWTHLKPNCHIVWILFSSVWARYIAYTQHAHICLPSGIIRLIPTCWDLFPEETEVMERELHCPYDDILSSSL